MKIKIYNTYFTNIKMQKLSDILEGLNKKEIN